MKITFDLKCCSVIKVHAKSAKIIKDMILSVYVLQLFTAYIIYAKPPNSANQKTFNITQALRNNEKILLSILAIFYIRLEIRKVHTRWLPKILTFEQNHSFKNRGNEVEAD